MAVLNAVASPVGVGVDINVGRDVCFRSKMLIRYGSTEEGRGFGNCTFIYVAPRCETTVHVQQHQKSQPAVYKYIQYHGHRLLI